MWRVCAPASAGRRFPQEKRHTDVSDRSSCLRPQTCTSAAPNPAGRFAGSCRMSKPGRRGGEGLSSGSFDVYLGLVRHTRKVNKGGRSITKTFNHVELCIRTMPQYGQMKVAARCVADPNAHQATSWSAHRKIQGRPLTRRHYHPSTCARPKRNGLHLGKRSRRQTWQTLSPAETPTAPSPEATWIRVTSAWDFTAYRGS